MAIPKKICKQILTFKLYEKVFERFIRTTALKADIKACHVEEDISGSSVGIDYKKYITKISEKRKPSTLRELTNILSKMPPDTIFLGVGSPNANTFPFESINLKLKDGTALNVPEQVLKIVLQYLPSAGYPPLFATLKDFQNKFHGEQDWEKKSILITSGAQDGAYQAINMLLNPGDPLLIQNPVYPGFADILRPMGTEFLPIGQDQNGMRPDILDKVLEERFNSREKKMPKVLYVNPTGSNPTATLLSDDRKKQIYSIAQRYNLIILEDDPYYFVHYLKDNPRSFLSLDADSRVIRFDSFSKILSAGLRLGYVTGPKVFLERMNLHMQISTMHSSGISQAIVYALLQHWGLEGFKKHLNDVRAFYKERRDNMLKSAERHLKDVATWNTPQGGMFLWLKISPVPDLKQLLTQECVSKKLLVAPGYAFNVDVNDTTQYVRLSFSVATHEQVDEGVKILGQLIRENKIK